MQTLYNNFKSSFLHLLQGETRVAVAVSGGPDSMALALLLGHFAKESGIKILAITVDHRLRPESENEAMLVGKWLAGYGIDHQILYWYEGPAQTANIQAGARKARYRLMANFCEKNQIKTLAVAHTLDDQAETVLMRLMRGSGIDGLSGISESSNIFGIRVIRPLLKVTGAELKEYLSYTSQKWVNDPSNQNTKYTRVQVRNLIKSNNNPELLTARLADTAMHMSRARNYIEEKIKHSLAGIFTFYAEGFYVINTEGFQKLHEEEQLRSLAAALQHTSGDEYKPRFENLTALRDRIINNNINGSCTLWGCTIAASKKKQEQNLIFIYRENNAIAADINASDPQQNVTFEWDGRFTCQIMENNLGSLTIGMLGADGYNTICNEGFTPALPYLELPFSVPKKIFYSLPALKNLEKLLAVPHIGYYADEGLKSIFKSQIKAPPRLFTSDS